MSARKHREVATPVDIDAWLASRWRLTVVLMLTLAGLLRVVCFVQANDGPLMDLHRWDQSDMNHFASWADQIAAGDWLSRRVEPPIHDWHVETVRRQILNEPQRLAEFTAAGVNVADPASIENPALRQEARTRWNAWIGNGRLYQDPLYVYALAIVRMTLGDDVRWVLAGQMILGMLCVWLMMAIARTCFGELAGALAGLLGTLNGPLLFYEIVLLRETPVTFAGLAIVWLTLRAIDKPTKTRWLITGLAIGAAITLKSQFMLLLPWYVLGLAVTRQGSWRVLIHPLSMMFAGVVIALSPLMARNVAVGVAPLSGAGNGGASIVLSGAADATERSWGLDHVGAILEQTHGSLGSTMLATLRTHDSVGSVVGLAWRKFVVLWHWYEIPNNENFYYARLAVPLLKWMPVTWAVVAPLGLVGIVLGANRWRKAWPLYVLVICGVAVLVMFFVLSRLRVPLMAALTPFAALALASMIQWIVAAKWREAAIAGLAVAAFAMLICAPLPAGVPRIRLGDYISGYASHWLPRIQQAEAANDVSAIERAFAKVIRLQDSLVGELGPQRRAASAAEADIAKAFQELYAQHARALHLLNRPAEAEVAQQHAARLKAAL